MEEGKNHTGHETRHTKQQGRYQISSDKPSQHRRKNTGKGTDKQNKPPHLFY